MGLEAVLNERSKRAEEEKQQTQQQAETEKQQAQQQTQQKVEGGVKEVYESREKQVASNAEKQEAGERRKIFVEKKKVDLAKIKALRTELGLAEMDTDDAGELLQGMGLTLEEKKEALADITSTEAGIKEATSTEEQKLGEINAINASTEKTVGDADVMGKIHEDALKQDEEREELKMQAIEGEDQKLSTEEKIALEEKLLDQWFKLGDMMETGESNQKRATMGRRNRLSKRIFRLGGPRATKVFNEDREQANKDNYEFDEPKRRLAWERDSHQGIAMDEDKIFDKYKVMNPEERDVIEKDLVVKLEEVRQKIEELKKQEEEAADEMRTYSKEITELPGYPFMSNDDYKRLTEKHKITEWSQVRRIEEARKHLENWDFPDLSREIRMLRIASGTEQQASNIAS